MRAFMKMGAESRETGRLPGEDEMSNKTSVISSAAGPPTHESSAKRVEEELANLRAQPLPLPIQTWRRRVRW
jgi:hypothetical protein